MPDDKNSQKEVVKEALKEWLDDKFLTFGKWSATAIGAAALTALVYFVFWFDGWKK